MEHHQIHHHFQPTSAAGFAGPAMLAGTGFLAANSLFACLKAFFRPSSRSTQVIEVPVIPLFEPISATRDNTAVVWRTYGLEYTPEMSPVAAFGDVLEQYEKEQERVQRQLEEVEKAKAVKVQLEHLDMLVKMKARVDAETVCIPRPAEPSSDAVIVIASWSRMVFFLALFGILFAKFAAKFDHLDANQATWFLVNVVCWIILPFLFTYDFIRYVFAVPRRCWDAVKAFPAYLKDRWTTKHLAATTPSSSHPSPTKETPKAPEIDMAHLVSSVQQQILASPAFLAIIDQEVSHRVQAHLSTIKTTLDPLTDRLTTLETHLATETSTNTHLVDRLFKASYQNSDSALRFQTTTPGVKGTAQINKVVTSHLETIVILVNDLKRQVDAVARATPQRGMPFPHQASVPGQRSGYASYGFGAAPSGAAGSPRMGQGNF